MNYLSTLKTVFSLSLMLSIQGFAAALPEDIAERNRIQRNLDSGQFDLQSINKGVMVAAALEAQVALEVFLGQPKNKLRPTQQGIRAALFVMMRLNRGKQIKWLLNYPDTTMRPDQEAINGAYRDATAKSLLNAQAALKPYVSLSERQDMPSRTMVDSDSSLSETQHEISKTEETSCNSRL